VHASGTSVMGRTRPLPGRSPGRVWRHAADSRAGRGGELRARGRCCAARCTASLSVPRGIWTCSQRRAMWWRACCRFWKRLCGGTGSRWGVGTRRVPCGSRSRTRQETLEVDLAYDARLLPAQVSEPGWELPPDEVAADTVRALYGGACGARLPRCRRTGKALPDQAAVGACGGEGPRLRPATLR
jgi:hypothetical protein